jgi:hypothetical protein
MFISEKNLEDGSTTFKELVTAYTELRNAQDEFRSMAESYGIVLPELTREQKQDIIKMIWEQRKEGNDRQEIRDIIVDMLIEYGFDLPDLTDEQRRQIRDRIQTMLQDEYGFVFIELTPEQKAYIKQTFIQMRRQGASDESIRDEIRTLYESYGGVLPDLLDLIDEQMENLTNKREEIKGLKENLRDLIKDANRITRWRFFKYVQRDILI